MGLNEIIDAISKHIIMIEPPDISGFSEILNLMDEIKDERFQAEKEELKKKIEEIILNEFNNPEKQLSELSSIVEKMQQKLMNIEQGVCEPSAQISTEKEPQEEKPTENKKEESVEEKEIEYRFPPELLNDIELVNDFITESRENLDSIEVNIVKWEESPEDTEIINAIFRPFHTIKGVSGFLNINHINHLSHQLENLLDAARNKKINFSPEVSEIILQGTDLLRNMIDEVEYFIQNGNPPEIHTDYQHIIQQIDAILSGKQVESLVSQPSESSKITSKVSQEVPEQQKNQKTDSSVSLKKLKTSETIRIDTQKMDLLLEMVGELVIIYNMISQNPKIMELSDRRTLSDLSQLKRITSTLQHISLSMRMVPIGNTFQKMHRIVRDLSRKNNKKIELRLVGESTEIDRNIVEKFYDPLVHMVRNSCDHGIEPPEERKKKGKPEKGIIELKAYHKGGNIVIEIKDDGRGLDKEAIYEKALSKGLIKGPISEYDENEIFSFIFHPGFSTAKVVTDVSGRGVGMDVVKKTIEQLHGKIEIVSEKDKGTTFIVKLPLTLAIIDGLIVKVAKEKYIIPTINVKEVIICKREDYNLIVGKGETIKVRGKILPLIRLHRLFNIEGAIEEPWRGVIMIIETEKGDIALLVDGLIGKQEVVIKNIGTIFKQHKGISGGAILGDGKVGLILDINNLYVINN